jgi:hypothetical protein
MNGTYVRKLSALVAGVAVTAVFTAEAAVIEYRTPNVVTGLGPTSVQIGDMLFVNHGLQGVGRVSASLLDAFGETFGSISSMAITDWTRSGNSYSGTFLTLPDRGYNAPANSIFSNYRARIQELSFSFTPFTGGGAAPNQNQIEMTYRRGTLFNVSGNTTTGLDPAPGAPGVGSLDGKPVPFVGTFNGNAINKIAIDAEGLALSRNGTGYLSDEYGPNVYYFRPGVDKNGNKINEILAVLPLPEALLPRGGGSVPASQLNYTSVTEPATGRRNNQGMEGLSLSPDGKQLYALMQSATMQDSTSSQQTRLNTRLLVYDIKPDSNNDGVPEHVLASEFVLQLPIFTRNGNGGAPNRTAAQSEIVSLGNGKLLVLSRDGNGLGADNSSQAMFKSILLVDTKGATNILGKPEFDAPDGQIAPNGVLEPTITPLEWGQALNMLNSEQLARFGINLNFGAPDTSTLSEKWEGLGLISALDPDAPNDYFLFIGNDNDFLTQTGRMLGADDLYFNYDAKAAFENKNLYANNDTWMFAYRVTLQTVPEPLGLGLLALTLIAGACALRGWSRNVG